MSIIAPQRGVALLHKNLPDRRFSSFMEDTAREVNNLMAKPTATEDSDYTFVLEDRGTIKRKTSSTQNQVYTIPSNDSVSFDIGTMIEVQNDGSVAMKVAINSDTLTFEADGTTGTRTIAAAGSGRFVKVAATAWKCRGQQMT